MVTIPKTGEILAMVGSEDYFDTKTTVILMPQFPIVSRVHP